MASLNFIKYEAFNDAKTVTARIEFRCLIGIKIYRALDFLRQ